MAKTAKKRARRQRGDEAVAALQKAWMECPDCIDPWPKGAQVRRINLALQGGGSHGAFAWGVLDRLLEDERIAIEGISGTSAGAVNGAVAAYGLTVGGRDKARALLDELWQRIASVAALTPLQPTPLDRMLGVGRMDFSPGYWMLDTMARVLSPYQFNALSIDPLRDVVGSLVDFDVLRHCETVKLFVGATDIKRCRVKVFELAEMSLDAVMASACLPFLHQAVEIDGEAYWDGGYSGNPAIFPLIYGTEARDVLLVQINPINHDDVPTTAQGILDRLNTVTFNATLMREMRAIAFVTKLIDGGFDDEGRLKRLLIHVIEAEDEMRALGVSSKLNADWTFLQHLRDIGRARAETWLGDNHRHLGKKSTVDIGEMFL